MPVRTFDGAALRDARLLAGIPAAELGATVHRTEWAIWSYERGLTHPPIEVAAGLADALHLRLDQLLTTPVMAVA